MNCSAITIDGRCGRVQDGICPNSECPWLLYVPPHKRKRKGGARKSVEVSGYWRRRKGMKLRSSKLKETSN